MEGLEKIRFEMSYNKKNYHSAGFGRKVILVIFVIFELGPDSESLCNALPSESAVGLCHFFIMELLKLHQDDFSPKQK